MMQHVWTDFTRRVYTMHPLEMAIHIERVDQLFVEAIARVELAVDRQGSPSLN